MDYIQEAFKKLNLLEEEVFDVTENGVEELNSFVTNDEDETDTIKIIDDEAETEEDLDNSYIGQGILECNVCHSLIYKNMEDINISEDGKSANEDEECPYCFTTEGYKIVGKVAPFISEDDEEIEIEDSEDFEEDDEDFEDYEEDDAEIEIEDSEEDLQEDFKNVEIETDTEKMSMSSDDTGRVVVETEPIINQEEIETEQDIIAPIDAEDKEEIENKTEEEPADDSEISYNIDEFDDESFNNLGENYLKKIYSNVDSYVTESIKENGNKLIVEGTISFKSGNKKITQFIFEANKANKKGNVTLLGENAQITRGHKSFKLNAKINNNKLVCEALTYNYMQKDSEGKSNRVYGRIRG